jgi:hypothetical protein
LLFLQVVKFRIERIVLLSLLALWACGGTADDTNGAAFQKKNETIETTATATPTPTPTATPTPVPTIVPLGAPTNITIEDFQVSGFWTSWNCSYYVTWGPPAGTTGEGITYEYCVKKFRNEILEVNRCFVTADGSQSEGTSFFSGETYRIESTVTSLRGSERGGSTTIQQICS